jgi:hypothetical protein
LAAYNKFNAFVENLAEKVHKLDTDTLKVFLSNDLPTATDAVKADIIEITAQFGYAAGGATVAQSSSAQTGGTYRLVIADPTFTASGGDFGPFQYAVLYNDTPTSPADPLIAWWNYGAPITITNGNSFTVDLDQVNGVFTLA